jgi:hypothetical protein
LTQNHCNADGKYPLKDAKCQTGRFKETQDINCEMFQEENVKDAAFGCDWVGTPIPFQRCLLFINATANKGFQLTGGKFVPVSNLTMMNVGRINNLYYF